MICAVYKIKNLVNNKVYIGSTVNTKNREYKHFWMLNKGIHDNEHLQKSFNKYGSKNFVFEIVEIIIETVAHKIKTAIIPIAIIIDAAKTVAVA